MSAHYRIPITPRLRPLSAQIAAEYRAGAGFALLVAKYRTHSNMIGAILMHEGVERRKRGGSYPGQSHRGPRVTHRQRVSRYAEQHDGDLALFAKPVRRVLCPHGLMVLGKPKPCVCSEDGACGQCVAEHQVSATPRSGWGAEQNPYLAWRSAGGAV